MKQQIKSMDSNLPTKGMWLKMLISLLILIGIGYIFSRYPSQYGGGWYHHLNQPFFAPAYWVPFVMWSLVYVLMGCSIGIIWHYAAKSPHPQTVSLAKNGIMLFVIHLVFNLVFPLILIGFHLPVVALIDILILIAFVIFLIRFFKRISHTASYLLIPYLLWIIYAAALNVAIIVLN